MSTQINKTKALLLPADGSEIRFVSCNIIEKRDEDVVDSGLAEFFDPIPDLKPWLIRAYQGGYGCEDDPMRESILARLVRTRCTKATHIKTPNLVHCTYSRPVHSKWSMNLSLHESLERVDIKQALTQHSTFVTIGSLIG
jgi:hypothetical protein